MIEQQKTSTCSACVHSCMKQIFTTEDLELIDRNSSEMSFKETEVIVKQGSYVAQVVFIKTGLIKIVLEGRNEKNSILKLVGNGNFVALPVLGNPNTYPHSVIAVKNCEVCFIRIDAMTKIMERNIEANRFILKWFTDDYEFMYNKITALSTRNNHGKLALALLYLDNSNFDDEIMGHINRKELAELASVSLESANKILTELKNDRIIDIDNKRIILQKKELVEKLSTIG